MRKRTIVVWSQFARNQKEYAQRLVDGEQFVIIHASQPIALVRPISVDDVTIVVKGETNE